MLPMNNIIRDCGEVWNRLFDHRPFLSGEILYFQEEFEVKRNDREVTRLFEVLEHATEIRDTQIDKVKTLSENIQTYQEKINTALSKCNSILDGEKNHNIDKNLEVKREIRKCGWEQFETDMQTKYDSVDHTFDEKERELFKMIGSIEEPEVKICVPQSEVRSLKKKINSISEDRSPPSDIRRKIKENEKEKSPLKLTVGEVRWVKENVELDCPIHEWLQKCYVELPEPPVLPRNPELEARIQRLKLEQQERDYQNMTRNVDSMRAKMPDESIASQLKQINRQLIAVLQFIVSVGAGFAFGFIGVELIVGDLDFGFRLLLGVMCALIIALAEIYFLAKQLAEDVFPVAPPQKSHQD